MTPARHREAHPRSRLRPEPWRVTIGTVAAGVLLVSFFGVRALASGGGEGGDSPRTASFTGVVTQFADDGALMCVRRQGSSGAPFCDLFYVPPQTPRIDVGDRVMVSTITSQARDGSPVSGMLVTPLP